MNNKFLITSYIDMDDLYNEAYEDVIDEGYLPDEEDFDDLVAEKVDELLTDDRYIIEDGLDLERWWRDNGWTLDRGYGGPNYKERVAAQTNWENLFDLMTQLKELDGNFGWIIYTPTEANDMVIFHDEFYEDEEKLVYEVRWSIVGNIDEELQNFLDDHNIEVQDNGPYIQFIGRHDDLQALHDTHFMEYTFELKEY